MGQLEFTEFYQTEQDRCLRAVLAVVGDRQLAEDLVSEAFTRAWMSWQKVRRHPAPRAWIVRTALNIRVSWWRRRRREVELDDAHEVVDATVGDREVDPKLLAVLRQLPQRQREVIVFRVFDDPLTFALTDPAEALFVTGIGEVCERSGIGLVLIPRGSSDDLVQRALVDGFVLHCDQDGDSRVDTATGRGLPVVVVDGPARPGAGHIGINDCAAAETAARHLVELGHQRTAVLASPLHADGRAGLTTVSQPHRDKGRAAAEQLLDPATRAPTTFPTTLIVRGSSGPPRTPTST